MDRPVTRQSINRDGSRDVAPAMRPASAGTAAHEVAGPASEVLPETFVVSVAADGSTVMHEPSRPVLANPGPPR